MRAVGGVPLQQESDGAECLDDEEIEDDMTQEDELLGATASQIHLYEAVARIDRQEVEIFGRGANEEPAVVESRIENVRIVQQYIQAAMPTMAENCMVASPLM